MKALVVEDIPAVAEVISEFLKIIGFLPQIAFSAKSALKKLQENKFDFLVIDGDLPDKDGPSLVKEIKRTYLHIPILGISSNFYSQAFLEAGANAFLLKPFTFAEFKQVVEEITNSHHVLLNNKLFHFSPQVIR
jgi:DNA-binding response OmpR family regulator